MADLLISAQYGQEAVSAVAAVTTFDLRSATVLIIKVLPGTVAVTVGVGIAVLGLVVVAAPSLRRRRRMLKTR